MQSRRNEFPELPEHPRCSNHQCEDERNLHIHHHRLGWTENSQLCSDVVRAHGTQKRLAQEVADITSKEKQSQHQWHGHNHRKKNTPTQFVEVVSKAHRRAWPCSCFFGGIGHWAGILGCRSISPKKRTAFSSSCSFSCIGSSPRACASAAATCTTNLGSLGHSPLTG